MKRHPLHRLSFTIMGNRSAALETARSRLVVLSICFILAYLVVSVRLFDLMILQGAFWSDDGQVVSAYEPAAKSGKRADILDRNGMLLATSLKTASLYADPKFVVDAKETAAELAKIFPDETYESYLKKLTRPGRFVWLKRNLVPEEQMAIMKIGDPGLAFKEEYRRVYPQGELASHIVGYTNVDGKGLAGLERGFDDTLENDTEHAMRTTIDVRLQHALRQEIKSTIDKFTAKAGAGLIMNVKTGEVLALTSVPDFDPHQPSNPSAEKMFNRPTLGVYELGSVFKIFSIAALLEKDEKNIFKTYDATKPLKRGRFTITDYHGENRVLSVPEIFMVSSNIGTALIGEDVGTDGLKAFYKKLGLMNKPDTSLMEVGKPLYPEPWRELNTLTASYGHGIAVSPLQLTTAFAQVVNGGLQVHPTFVLPQNDPLKTTSVNEERKSTRLVSEETSQAMRALLRLVVSDGTAKNAEVPGYEVGGKTGTAEQPGLRGYDKKRLISSFIATFPVTDPEYAVFVLIDEPHGTKESYGYATAGWTAAPAVGRVIQRMVSIMGIPPYENPQSDAHSGKQMVSHVEGVKFE